MEAGPRGFGCQRDVQSHYQPGRDMEPGAGNSETEDLATALEGPFENYRYIVL